MNNEQFVKVPNIDLTSQGLEMKDLVIYAYLKKHYNNITKEMAFFLYYLAMTAIR